MGKSLLDTGQSSWGRVYWSQVGQGKEEFTEAR